MLERSFPHGVLMQLFKLRKYATFTYKVWFATSYTNCFFTTKTLADSNSATVFLLSCTCDRDLSNNHLRFACREQGFSASVRFGDATGSFHFSITSTFLALSLSLSLSLSSYLVITALRDGQIRLALRLRRVPRATHTLGLGTLKVLRGDPAFVVGRRARGDSRAVGAGHCRLVGRVDLLRAG